MSGGQLMGQSTTLFGHDLDLDATFGQPSGEMVDQSRLPAGLRADDSDAKDQATDWSSAGFAVLAAALRFLAGAFLAGAFFFAAAFLVAMLCFTFPNI